MKQDNNEKYQIAVWDKNDMVHKAMKDIPESERPFEKCLIDGPVGLSDEELLSVIFRSGTTKKRITEISRSIVTLCEEYGGLGFIGRIPLKELMSLEGVGKVRSIQLLCIYELAKRISQKRKTTNITSISWAGDIYDIFSDVLSGLEVEENWAVFLDGKNNIIKRELMTRGTANSSILPVREILKTALRAGAVGIILIHNHPSGDPTPSEQDILITRQFKKACLLTDIELVDHIIIGSQRYVSMKFEGHFD